MQYISKVLQVMEYFSKDIACSDMFLNNITSNTIFFGARLLQVVMYFQILQVMQYIPTYIPSSAVFSNSIEIYVCVPENITSLSCFSSGKIALKTCKSIAKSF